MPTGAVPDRDPVAEAIREVGHAEVLSRFRSLRQGDVDEKSPGDFVTVADHACEVALEERLRTIRDVPVVGEEGSGTDPSLLELVDHAPAVWVVDPIDGTSNFVAGSSDFVVMVALLEAGLTVAGWIWHPVTDRLLSARLGGGTWEAGRRRSVPSVADRRNAGVLKYGSVPRACRASVTAIAAELDLSGDRGCAGLEYHDIVDGRSSFLFYWRTNPWDHAAGGLIAAEAGATVARLDGEDYRPGDGRRGLLTAAPDVWTDLGPRLHRATAR